MTETELASLKSFAEAEHKTMLLRLQAEQRSADAEFKARIAALDWAYKKSNSAVASEPGHSTLVSVPTPSPVQAAIAIIRAMSRDRFKLRDILAGLNGASNARPAARAALIRLMRNGEVRQVLAGRGRRGAVYAKGGVAQ